MTGEEIRELRRSCNMKQVPFGRLVMNLDGTDNAVQKVVSKIETGERKISAKELTAVLQYCKTQDRIELLKVGIPHVSSQPVPVISWVYAGTFAEPVDHWPVGISGEGEPVFSHHKVGIHAFGLRVKGDSMAPRYLPGDVIIVDPEIRCDNGSACVVWINGEVSLKIFFEGENEIRLVPMNETHEIRVIPKNRKVDFRVIGKVVDMVPKL